MTLSNIFSEMSVTNVVQIIGILVSLLTSVVAIVISIVTVKQNSKMIEASTKASIGIYGAEINPGSPMFLFVIRNFGNSSACFTRFDYDFDFSNCYGNTLTTDYLKSLSKCVLAPGQSKICNLK
ncbi:MAG: hypothetical protein Q4B26_03815, partial [Eubacteriales bacterium]|nr:hypothetical protein [Eubacteriales bacterium]